MKADHYDILVVGGGPGGCEAARLLARGGRKTALIEGRDIGGTCLNRGCIPAKTMLYCAEVYRELQKISEYGIEFDLSTLRVNFSALIAKRKNIIEKLRKGLLFQLQKDRVEIIRDHADLAGDRTLRLRSDKREITADHIILATGGRSRRFPGFQEADPRYLTSDNIFELNELPRSLTIVGGGPVGTEFASFFHTLGTEVHLIDQAPVFLGNYDHRLGKELEKSFLRSGIHCHLGTGITAINHGGNDLKIALNNGVTIESQFILSSVGVEPLTDFIKTDLRLENGRVWVNDELLTSSPAVSALGDLIGRSGSAYGAEREAKFIAHRLLGENTALTPLDYTAMPDVVFSHPEVATCGLSEQELQNTNHPYFVKETQFLVNAKAQIKNETRGKIWLYAEKETQRILGVHVIGAQATEIIHQIPLVLLKKITIPDYLRTVWGHPVMAEIIKEVLTTDLN